MCRRWAYIRVMNSYKLILACLLLLIAGMGYGQTGSGIDVPANARLLLHVYGKGVQIYVCTPTAGDSSKYVWTPAGARASLYLKDGKETGKHYFNAGHRPVWELTDGSTVVANKLRQVDAPDPDVLFPFEMAALEDGRLEH